MKYTYIITAVIFVLLFIPTAYFISVNTSVSNVQTSNSPTPTLNVEIPSVSPIIPEDWLNFSDTNLGISFYYPANFEVQMSGSQSIMATLVSGTPSQGFPRFFYVSVIPKNMETQPGEIYNYNLTDFEKLFSTQENESVNLSDNEGQKEWYLYERQSDENIKGHTAKVFINKKPWEFPNGTWEYRYIFEFKDKFVQAGAYVDEKTLGTEFNITELKKIMNSLIVNE